MGRETILGIWDGHDAGAALIKDNKIVFAINEERLSRKKLDVGFPELSIKETLKFAKLTPKDIDVVAFSTSDFAKTLTRVFPHLKNEYYLLRRKKKAPGSLASIKKHSKYIITQWPPTTASRLISKNIIKKKLKKLGFKNTKLSLADHHQAHAATAAFCSGFKECISITIDGIGDGLSGSIWSFRDGTLSKLKTISGKDSLGIFFEHVTNIMNMRELEDEGKVMALANFACPIPDQQNPLISFFEIEGLNLRCKYSSTSLYRKLKEVLWYYPSEQFAYMAQRTLEYYVVELIKNITKETKHKNIAYSGGVASNVKINMQVRELEEVEQLFVFPHMGDGGLALGAAMLHNYQRNKVSSYKLEDVYLGPDYKEQEIKTALESFEELKSETPPSIHKKAAELIANGEILLWFQHRMEYGPRALGARSIIASPSSLNTKDELNLKLKNRVWYQPFCPSMLEEDAVELLENYDGIANPFMTCAYRVKAEKRELIPAVINVDGSCRPQIIDKNNNSPFAELLRALRQKTGLGVILNTSFNIHGEPVVNTPGDALDTFRRVNISHLILNNNLISKR